MYPLDKSLTPGASPFYCSPGNRQAQIAQTTGQNKCPRMVVKIASFKVLPFRQIRLIENNGKNAAASVRAKARA